MAFTDSQTCKETFSIIKGTIIIENYEQIIHEPNYLKKKTHYLYKGEYHHMDIYCRTP